MILKSKKHFFVAAAAALSLMAVGCGSKEKVIDNIPTGQQGEVHSLADITVFPRVTEDDEKETPGQTTPAEGETTPSGNEGGEGGESGEGGETTPEITEPVIPEAVGVTTMSLYKNYKTDGVRKKIVDSFDSAFTAGADISSFEVIASEDEVIQNNSRQFMYIWKEYWEKFEDRDACKIGYFVSFDLKDGTHIEKTIKKPSDVDSFFKYMECYLYDDINQTPGQWYSHITDAQMTDTSILTSIKFHCGTEVDKIGDHILLTAFIYTSDADFNEDGKYIGTVSASISINRT